MLPSLEKEKIQTYVVTHCCQHTNNVDQELSTTSGKLHHDGKATWQVPRVRRQMIVIITTDIDKVESKLHKTGIEGLPQM